MADALSSVLHMVDISAVDHVSLRVTSPFGFRVPERPGAAFYVCLRLQGVLTTDDQRYDLGAGDFVVLPHGRAHTIADRPGRRLKPLPSETPPGSACSDTSGREAHRFVAGRFHLDELGAAPLRAVLPPVLHVPGQAGQPIPALASALRIIVGELRSPSPGGDVMVARASEMLFICAIRHYLEQLSDDALGWLAALRDPALGRVIDAMHQRPGAPWTVDSLAAVAGMSRSSFCERFTAAVGESPIHYLTRWRMQQACVALRDPRRTMRDVAVAAGYASEEAFNKAFSRHIGRPPGAWRRAIRS